MPRLVLAVLCWVPAASASPAGHLPTELPPVASPPNETSVDAVGQAGGVIDVHLQSELQVGLGERKSLRQTAGPAILETIISMAGASDLGNAPEHVVEHQPLLNREAFWWLMGTVVLSVGIAVVRLETDPNRYAEDAPLVLHTQPSRSEVSNSAVSQESDSGACRDARPVRRWSRRGGAELRDSRSFFWLAFCAIMLYVSQLCWGVTQEFVMTQRYQDAEGNVGKVHDAQFVVLCNRIASFFLAGLILKARGSPLFFEGFSASVWPAATNAIASWCQYRSLLYISFALQTTAKSAKLFPVLVLDSLRGKRHTLVDYAETLVIISGLIVFGLETELDESQSKSTTVVGILLLCGLVFADSLTPHLQDIMFRANPAMDAIEMCFSMSCLAMVILGAMQAVSGHLFANIAFLWQYPDAMVHIGLLSATSFLTQYFISLTISEFGPVVFTLVASLRQVLAVGVSVVLFKHHMSSLAAIAMIIIIASVLVRVLRPLARKLGSTESSDLAAGGMADESQPALMMCAFAIHTLYCFYAVAQEFLATHTFDGQLFEFPLFMVAVNHTIGTLFALAALSINGTPLCMQQLRFTALPSFPNLVATFLQHQALYSIRFPTQTLMKTLKIIPVMLAGTVLRIRYYSIFDYAEGALITVLVAYFVWDFQLAQTGEGAVGMHDSVLGILLMVGYLVSDSFTSNLEDYAYQKTTLDPGQMLFGMEAFSAALAWSLLLMNGQLHAACSFILSHERVWLYVALLALASGSGAYTCTLTVRMFGPTVFTLLMTSRQIVSLIISVFAFQHAVNGVHTLCLAVVATLVLTSSLRRVSMGETASQPFKSSYGMGLLPDVSNFLPSFGRART